MEEYYPSEIARLVLGYLDDVKCENSWHTFMEECEDLQEHYRRYKLGKVCSTNVGGESLLDILTTYCALKSFFDQIICQNSWKLSLEDILHLQEHYVSYKNGRIRSSNANGKVIIDVLKKWALKITNKTNSCPSCSSNISCINFLCPDSVSSINHHSVQIQTSDTNCQNAIDSATQTEELECNITNSSEDQFQQITERDAVCSHNNDHHTSPTTNTNVQKEQGTPNAAQLSTESAVFEKQVLKLSKNHDFAKGESSQHSRLQISPLPTPDKDVQNRMEEDCVHSENEQEASNSNQSEKQISDISKNFGTIQCHPSPGGLSRDRLLILSYFTPKKNKVNWTETEMTPLRKNLAQIQENLNESPFSKGIELAETPFKLDSVGNMVLDNVKNSPEYNAILKILSSGNKVSRESHFLSSPGVSNMDTDNCSGDDEVGHVNEADDVEVPFNDADNGLNSAAEISVPEPSEEGNNSTAVISNKENNSSHGLPLEIHKETESVLQNTNFNEETGMGRGKLDQNVNTVSSSQNISNSDEPDTRINVAQICTSNLIVQNSSNSNVANEFTILEKNFEDQTALSDNISANNISNCLSETSALKGSGKNVSHNSKSSVPQELIASSDSQIDVAPHDSTNSLNNDCDKTIKELPKLIMQSNKPDGDINQNVSVNVSQPPVSQFNNSTSTANISDSQCVTLPVITQPVVIPPKQAGVVFSYPSLPGFVVPNNSVDPTQNIQYRIILNTLNTPMTWNTSGPGNLCISTQALPATNILNPRLIAPATDEVRKNNTANASQNVSSAKVTNPVPSRKRSGKLAVSSKHTSHDQNLNIRLPDKSPLKNRDEHLSIFSDDFSHDPSIPILLPDKSPIKNKNVPSAISPDDPACSSSVDDPPVTKSPPKKVERERSLSPRSSMRMKRDLWRIATATEKNKKYTKVKKKPEPKKSPKSKPEKKGNSSKRRRSYALRSKNNSPSKKSATSPSKKSATSPSKKSATSPSKKSKKTLAKSPKQGVPVLSIPESHDSTEEISAKYILSRITNQFEKELQSPVLKMLVPQGTTMPCEGNSSNASHVRCLNFGSKPPENNNVGPNKAKKKITKDKTVSKSVDKKHAKKKKKIKSPDDSDLKISKKKKKKRKKCSGTTLEKNSDSVPKSIDAISAECIVLNNDTCANTQHESDVQIKSKNDISGSIAVEECDVDIDGEKSNTEVRVEDSLVWNNADEDKSKTLEATECVVPTTDERTASNIKVSGESITQLMDSKQKKEFKKNNSPCMSRKGSPKNFKKALNKRKIRPPRKWTKLSDLSIIDRSAFNLNSDKSPSSKLGGVANGLTSAQPSVLKAAFQNSCDVSEEVKVIDLCEEDHISSAPSCSTTKAKSPNLPTVDNIGCQKIMGNTSVPVHYQKETENVVNELSPNKLQKVSPEKSHQHDSLFAPSQQEQPFPPTCPPIAKSYLEQTNKQLSQKMDVELSTSGANSTQHIYFPPNNAISENSKISSKNPDLNEKNITSQCGAENETGDSEIAISNKKSNLLSSCPSRNTFDWIKKGPLKKQILNLSSFKRPNIPETTLQKLKEQRVMKVSHSESLNVKQSDPSKEISTVCKNKSASRLNLASSTETDCLQLSNTTEVCNKPDKFSKSTESNDQMCYENIIEKSTAEETEGVSENITGNANCIKEMPVDMDCGFRGRKRRLSNSSCELQIVLNESMASSVESSPVVVKRKKNCKLSSSEQSPLSSPQKIKEAIISPVRCISKKTVHKSALSKKVEKDLSIPAGVKIPSKWTNSKIKKYSSAIREPAVDDKKINKGKKQVRKKTKQLADTSITTFKSVKMKLNNGKQGVSKKLFPETVEENNTCNDNKLSDFLDKKIHNSYVPLRPLELHHKALNNDKIEKAMLSENSKDNFQQASNESVLQGNVQETLNNQIMGSTHITTKSQVVDVADVSENFKDIVESDIGKSTEKESELAIAIAKCKKEMRSMQLNKCSPSPKNNSHDQESSKESEDPTSTGLTFANEKDKLAFILRLTEKIDVEKLLNLFE